MSSGILPESSGITKPQLSAIYHNAQGLASTYEKLDLALNNQDKEKLRMTEESAVHVLDMKLASDNPRTSEISTRPGSYYVQFGTMCSCVFLSIGIIILVTIIEVLDL